MFFSRVFFFLRNEQCDFKILLLKDPHGIQILAVKIKIHLMKRKKSLKVSVPEYINLGISPCIYGIVQELG